MLSAQCTRQCGLTQWLHAQGEGHNAASTVVYVTAESEYVYLCLIDQFYSLTFTMQAIALSATMIHWHQSGQVYTVISIVPAGYLCTDMLSIGWKFSH